MSSVSFMVVLRIQNRNSQSLYNKEATFTSLKSHDHHGEMCLDHEMVEWGSENFLFPSHFSVPILHIFFFSQEKSISK